MRKSIFLIILVVLCANHVKAIEQHPRLFVDDAACRSIKQTLQKDSNSPLAQLHALIVGVADDVLTDSDIVYQKDKSGKRILEVSRRAMDRILSCAYSYRLTGDSKYLQQAQKDIVSVCSFPDWNPSHYLDVAEMAMAVSVGYDWLYDCLQSEVKSLVEEIVPKFVFETFEKQLYGTKFLKMSTNWNQVCCAGLITAALALYETDPSRCSAIIDTCVESNKRQAVSIYAPDGAFPEGCNYWNYGTAYQCFLINALETATGNDRGVYEALGAFSNTGDFFIFQESGATSSVFNYYDNIDVKIGGFPLWYLAAKENNPNLLYGELKKIGSKEIYLNGEGVRFLTLIMGAASHLDLSNVSVPDRELYIARGMTPLVIVKRGWEQSPASRYLAMKGGCCGDSHGHMDAGSFVYDAAGVRWAYDISRPEYEDVEYAMAQYGYGYWPRKKDSKRWTLNFVNNRYHNTLTVNGKDHSVSGRGTLDSACDEKKMTGGTMDLSDVYKDELRQWKRTAVLDKKGNLSVGDQIATFADKDAVIEWRMVTKAEAKVERSGIRLTIDGKTALLSVDSPARCEYVIYEKGPMMPYDVLDLNEYTIVGFRTHVDRDNEITINTKIKLL